MQYLSSDKLVNLHTALYSRFRKYNLNLEAHIVSESVAGQQGSSQVIAYTRPASESYAVERLMGRDFPGSQLNLQCHPVIELRAEGEWLALELVIPPHAWVDQQNLVGKLSVDRQRREFRKMVSRLHPECRVGCWRGTHLDDMHLTAHHLSYQNVFEQWIATYTDGQDWFRIGMWYPVERINDESIVAELFNRAQELYSLYTFIVWNGNNDFRSFYMREMESAFA